jgi:tetratricopeptide (TPR) repeat protein
MSNNDSTDQLQLCEARIRQLTEQVELLEAALGVPSSVSWIQAAQRLKEAGNYRLAVAAYLEAARQDPSNASALNGAGVILGKHLGDLDGAEDCYQRALAAQPGFHSPIYNLACTAIRRGQQELGINLLALAIAANERYLHLAAIDPVFEPYKDHPVAGPILLDRDSSLLHLLHVIRPATAA